MLSIMWIRFINVAVTELSSVEALLIKGTTEGKGDSIEIYCIYRLLWKAPTTQGVNRFRD